MSMSANPPSSSIVNTEVVPAPDTPYTRLHITPFNPSLQNVVIPASILPRARNISFHTIQTLPEKPFGFVDLPTADADKLKKKLHGAVLKGSKMRIETARPESIPEKTYDEDTPVRKKKSKKRKPEPGVVEGVQLDGRKVKRGWTTTEQEMIEEKRKKAKKEKKGEKCKEDKKEKEKRSRVKSKYTDEPECLFKTKLPEASSSSRETEEDDSIHKKRKRKSDRDVVVHEFKKTVKYPTFLKSTVTTSAPEATTFDDGVGWVNSSGKVVEPVKKRRRPEGIPAPDPPKRQAKPVKKPVPAPREEDDEDDETSSSGLSSSDESEDEVDDTSNSDSELNVSTTEKTENMAPPKPPNVATQPLSSPSASKPESARPKSSSSVTNLSITIPPTTPAKKVHPLEALYKQPQGPDPASSNVDAQPFSFFGNDDMEDEDSTAFNSQAPMTPFTRQEFEFRNVRSAAPTPDTAHPSRSFNFWASQGSAGDAAVGADDEAGGLDHVPEVEEDEDIDMEGGPSGPEETSQTPLSDFQRQFWESRGDLNRAWRKRRKAAAKDKRYRENKARAERAI